MKTKRLTKKEMLEALHGLNQSIIDNIGVVEHKLCSNRTYDHVRETSRVLSYRDRQNFLEERDRLKALQEEVIELIVKS